MVLRMNRKEDGFAKFPDLPYYLRCQIWGELMPAGIYLVECCPVHVDHADNQDGRKPLRLALRPAGHLFQDYAFKERVRTHKALLATCKESRAEVCRRFPNVLRGGGPRLSVRHDLIYMVSDILQKALMGLGLPSGTGTRLEFEGDWNKIHRLALDSSFCDFWPFLLRKPTEGWLWTNWHSKSINGLMGFLTTCTSLRQLFLTSPGGLGRDQWTQVRREDQLFLSEKLADYYGGLMCQPNTRLNSSTGRLAGPVSLLRQLILGDLEGNVHRDWVGKVGAGYPVLKDLEILKMVDVSRELRWLCKDV